MSPYGDEVRSDQAQHESSISYRRFGEEFFARAVSLDQVLAAVGVLAGQPIDLGPTPVGPGGLVKIRARGSVGQATGEVVADPEAAGFRVRVPVTLSFSVDMGVDTHRFDAQLVVPVTLFARALEGVRILVDVVPPRGRDIEIDLRAQGLRASVMQRVVGMESEVRRFVASYVARELDKPELRAARTIDVGAAIDEAWERFVPSRPAETTAEWADDLEEALQDEDWSEPTEESR